MDIKIIFLNENLVEDVYMAQLDVFILAGEIDKICKLEKSIYELKQA